MPYPSKRKKAGKKNGALASIRLGSRGPQLKAGGLCDYEKYWPSEAELKFHTDRNRGPKVSGRKPGRPPAQSAPDALPQLQPVTDIPCPSSYLPCNLPLRSLNKRHRSSPRTGSKETTEIDDEKEPQDSEDVTLVRNKKRRCVQQEADAKKTLDVNSSLANDKVHPRRSNRLSKQKSAASDSSPVIEEEEPLIEEEEPLIEEEEPLIEEEEPMIEEEEPLIEEEEPLIEEEESWIEEEESWIEEEEPLIEEEEPLIEEEEPSAQEEEPSDDEPEPDEQGEGPVPAWFHDFWIIFAASYLLNNAAATIYMVWVSISSVNLTGRRTQLMKVARNEQESKECWGPKNTRAAVHPTAAELPNGEIICAMEDSRCHIKKYLRNNGYNSLKLKWHSKCSVWKYQNKSETDWEAWIRWAVREKTGHNFELVDSGLSVNYGKGFLVTVAHIQATETWVDSVDMKTPNPTYDHIVPKGVTIPFDSDRFIPYVKDFRDRLKPARHRKFPLWLETLHPDPD